jgi:hypothetical protein
MSLSYEVSFPSNGKMPWFDGLLEVYKGKEANTFLYPKWVIWASSSSALLFLVQSFS